MALIEELTQLIIQAMLVADQVRQNCVQAFLNPSFQRSMAAVLILKLFGESRDETVLKCIGGIPREEQHSIEFRG